MSEELRREFRAAIQREIFGEEWRVDKPLENLAPGMERLVNGACEDFEDYRRITANIAGLRRALAIYDEIFTRHYDVKEEHL